MDDIQDSFSGTRNSGVEQLREQVKSLQLLLSGVLAILILFGFCLNVYFFRDISLENRQLEQSQEFVKEHGFNMAEAAEFWNKLNEFAKTHPDFAPIISKYNISIGNTGAKK
jgi:hypothetical protein